MAERPWFRINRDLLVYKAFYFFFLSGFGSIFPYLPVYFRQIGLPASQVGLLLGLRPIVQFASAPFWAIMADKYKKRKSVLVMSVLSWLIMTLTLAFVEPTNEICEIQQGNNSHRHVYNYTRVKTGFFRRELLWQKADFDEAKKRKLIHKRAMDVVPIYITGQDKARFESSLRNKSLSDATKIHPNQSMVENATQGLKRIFEKRNNTFLFQKLDKKKQTSVERSDRGLYLRTLTSTRDLTESKDLVNKTGTNRLHSERGPKSKAKLVHTTSQTTTSHRALTHSIMPKYLWRFNKSGNFPNKNKNRKVTSKNLDKTHRQDHFNTGINHEYRNKKTGEINGTILTSYFQSPVVNIGKKDNKSSIDKRRQNNRDAPVVIEFSRILIPPGKDASDDSSGDHEGSSTGNGTKFLPHKTVHSTQHLQQVGASISEPLLSEAGLSNRINTSTKQVGGADIKAISNSLLQLKDKLSKIIGIDSKTTTTENGIIRQKGHATHSSNDSVVKSFNRSPTQTLQIRVHNKNVSNEIDKLHQSQSEKSGAEILIHTGISVLNSVNNTNDMMPSNGQNNTDELMPLNDSLSGSGNTLFTSSSLETNDNLTLYDLQTDIRESNETTLQKNYTNITLNRSSDYSLENPMKHISKAIQEELMKNTPQTAGDTQSKLWMTNLLKTNSSELKRIFTILLVLVVVGEFLEAPSTTLADASLLEHLGEERRYYGKQRLWGSLGFGLSSFLVGVLLEKSRHLVCGEQYTDYMICFCVFALLMILTLFISTTFKFQYKETGVKQTSVLSALCNIHYGSCLMAACFMGVGHGMSHSFLNWFLEDLGATKTLMGVAVICRSSLDLLTFFVAGSLIKAIGQIKIMVGALISYGVAFSMYSLLTNPWWVLPIEMLVGCTYAASWSACTSYMAGAASSESVTTIQGILQGVYWGLGTGSGTITGGFLIHHFGAVATFRCVAGASFVVCILFFLAQCKFTRESTEYTEMKYTYLPTVESKDTEELLRGYRVSKTLKHKHSSMRKH
ncbi:major facilitator superfamily domain-containing protein 6-like [Stylophora pistillata]|uniref:major facilitator superfamily domain-containing protein 6-like n=1 Tax=Stylophora pistillata TaxID=50429 RepID=UPI000C0421B0|nr:major facilitator superfamily domain-containing protein 6-like [Stylophora pistillata]